MEYAGHTWRLPKVRSISKSVPVTAPSPEDSEHMQCFTNVSNFNSFTGLPDIFDHDEGTRDRFPLDRTRRGTHAAAF